MGERCTAGHQRWTISALLYNSWCNHRRLRVFRPLVALDAAHLTSKYKGTLLVASGIDANDEVLALAWAIVDSEIATTGSGFVGFSSSTLSLSLATTQLSFQIATKGSLRPSRSHF